MSDIENFNHFYDFFWNFSKTATDAQLIELKTRPQFQRLQRKIFEILGDGDAEKGWNLLISWKNEFENKMPPDAPIHLFDMWKKFANDKKIQLIEEIRVLNPPSHKRALLRDS